MGLLAGLILLIGLLPLALRIMLDTYREELGTVPPDLILALRLAFDRSCVDEFWKDWSAGAEGGLLRAYQRAGGPVSSGLQAFIGRGILQIRRRRLGWGQGCLVWWIQ